MKLKPFLLTFLFTFAFLLSVCQNNTFSFLPHWEVGSKVTAEVQEHTVFMENGEVGKDSTSSSNFTIEIAKQTEDAYIIHLVNNDFEIQKSILAMDKSLKSKVKFDHITFKYRIDKKTGKSELINWKEAKTQLDKGIEAIYNELEVNNPEMIQVARVIINPFVKLFDSQENLESYMREEFGYVLFPYDKSFTVGDTISVVESCPNPFNPMGSLKQTTLSYISEVNTTKKVCKINSIEIVDLDDFNSMMQSMMKSMASGIAQIQGTNDSIVKKANDEINALKLEYKIDSKREMVFNYGNSWPETIITTRKIVMNNQGSVTVANSVTTINFK